MDLKDQRKEASLLSKGDSDSIIKKTGLELLSSLPLKNQTLIDLGCGKGEFLSLLRNKYPLLSLFGSDITNFNPNGNYNFVSLDFNTNFSNDFEKVDIITCLEVIEHLENPRHFIREISKMLKPGGHLILSTPNPESWTSIFSFIFRGYHSAFGGKCYPAHITPVPFVDLSNICKETQLLNIQDVHYAQNGRIPKTNCTWKSLFPFLKGKRYSDNYFIVAKKNHNK